MADEIAQVVDLEYKGVYYLLKGSKELIAKMAVMIKFLHEFNHKKWLEKPGSCSWQKIQEASEGAAPILEFPKEMFEESIDITNDPDVKGSGKISPFEYYCRKNDLRYCMMPDLNPNDDYIPVAVLSQEFGIHDEQIKAYMRRRVEKEEERDREYAEKIDDAKKVLENTKGEDKEKIERGIEELEDAKKQNGELLAESKKKMEKGNVLEFADYIRQAEDTTFFKDPELAKVQSETCGIVREFMPSACMEPIRDRGSVPEGGKIYYMQGCGDNTYISVERSFEMDEKGCVYSVYTAQSLLPDEGSLEITDKDCSKKEWEGRVSEFFKKAGLYMDQPMSVAKDLESYLDYRTEFDENFTKAPLRGQESEKEDSPEIMQARADAKQRKAYEESFYTDLTVPSEKIMPSDHQILSLELEDGLVEGVDLVSIDSDTAKISIRSDKEYCLVRTDGVKETITGDEVIKAVKGNTESEAASRKLYRGR